MLGGAVEKARMAGRAVSRLVTMLNHRGLAEEQRQYGLDQGRIVGLQLTDRDIREAEKRRFLPRKTFVLCVDPNGQVQRLKGNVEVDVLMRMTVATLIRITGGGLSVQEAYRLRAIQVRYMKNVEEQEKDFLRDSGLLLRVMNEVAQEVTKKKGGR